MPSTFSPSLRLELIAPGEQAGTWGTTTNTNLGTLVESSIAGYQTISVISADQALTIADGAADQSRSAMLRLTTTTGAAFNVYAPPVSKQYTVFNDSAHAVTIFNSTGPGDTTAAGAGVTIPAGRVMTVWSDGVAVRVQNSHLTADLVGNVTGSITGNAATATALQTARTIGGVSFDGTANINLPGVNTAGNQNTSGNAATAAALQTARTIGGVSFNGTANINLPGVNIAGNQNTSGNAGTATTLQTARTINGVSFDGSANITLPTVNTSGDQTIAGLKTFSSAVTGARFNPTSTSATGTGMYAFSPTTLAFSTDGTMRAALLSESFGTTLVVGQGLSLPSSSTGVIRAPDAQGTNIPGSQLLLRGGTSTGGAVGGSIAFYTSPPGAFGTTSNAPVERVRITGGGNVGIGQINPTARLWVEGSSTNDNFGVFQARNTNTDLDACAASFVVGQASTATSNVLVKFALGGFTVQSGQINANGANQAAFGTFSDRRLKENIVDLPSQLENICALHPVEFDYIESEGGEHQIGFVAQEMQEVYPDAVGERADGMLTVTGWSKTEARLVKALQEAVAEINTLKARLDAANL